MSTTQIKVMKGPHVMSTIGVRDPQEAAMLFWTISQKLKACGSELTIETNKGPYARNH